MSRTNLTRHSPESYSQARVAFVVYIDKNILRREKK